MKINTELIENTLKNLKTDLLEICTVEELNLDRYDEKIANIRDSINTLDTISIFIDDKAFITEFMAYSLVGNRLIDNSLDVFENKELRSSLIDSLCNMGVNLDVTPSNDLVESSIDNKILVKNINLNPKSKLDEIRKEMTSKEKVDLLVEEANHKIMTYFREPNDMKEYLNYMAKFHNYSPRNLSLIEEQFSGARAVGSFQFWSNHGFKINKGEKGIKILVPTKVTYLILSENEEKQLKYATKEEREKVKNGQIKTREKMYYKTGYVFDISQTNAKTSDLPKLFPNKWLEGEIKDYDNLYKTMNKIAEDMNVKIIKPKEELGASKGCFYPLTNEIALNPRNSQLQNVKTLLHELAHAKLHTLEKRNDYSKQEKEYQAEMVAYTTCSYFGIDTSDYSLDYLYNWSKNMDIDECIEIIEEVKETSKEYIEILQNELNKEIEIDLSSDKKDDKEKNQKENIQEELEVSKSKELEKSLILEEVYIKFRESKANEIKNGDIYNLEIASELIDLLDEKYTCLKSPIDINFEIYSNENCDKEPLYSGQIEIGTKNDFNLKNHLLKKLKNTEMNVDENIKTQLNKFFTPKIFKSKAKQMEL